MISQGLAFRLMKCCNFSDPKGSDHHRSRAFVLEIISSPYEPRVFPGESEFCTDCSEISATLKFPARNLENLASPSSYKLHSRPKPWRAHF